jgi:MFS family permease
VLESEGMKESPRLENKVAADASRSFSVAALMAFGIAVVSLLVAGLAKLVAWPIVSYTVKSALVFALLGGIGASLGELFRRSKRLLLKAFLILVSIAYLVVVSSFLALWFLPLKPEMGTVEDNIFDLVSILSGFAGLSLYEFRLVVTEQVTEPAEKGKVESIIESVLAKLSPSVFLIGGGTLMLLFAFGMYLGPDPSNPYFVPTLVAGGSGGLILGIAEWLALRSPRLARWLMAGSGILVIALLYFFVRMFIYE